MTEDRLICGDAWSQKSEKYHQAPRRDALEVGEFRNRSRRQAWDVAIFFILPSNTDGNPHPPSLLDLDAERNDARSYYNRGAAYYKNGDYDNAVADYTQAIELSLDGAYYAYLGRAEACHDKGDYDKAISDLTQAITPEARL